MIQNIFNAVCAEADAHAAHAFPPKDARQIVVTSPAANAAHRRTVHGDLKNGARVVIQPSGKQGVHAQRVQVDTCVHGARNEVTHTGQGRLARRVAFQQGGQRVEGSHGVLVVAQRHELRQLRCSRLRQSALLKFANHAIHPHLVKLVHRNRPVRELRLSHPPQQSRGLEQTAIVDLDSETWDSQRRKGLRENLNEFQLAQGALRSDDVTVALGELLVASLAGTVAAPHVLDLVTLEREGQFVAVHDHKAGKGHRQIIAQRLLADARRQRRAVFARQKDVICLGEVIPVVENLEDELIALLPVFASQRRKVLEGRRLDRHEAMGLEHVTQGAKHPMPAHHGARSKITGSLGD